MVGFSGHRLAGVVEKYPHRRRGCLKISYQIYSNTDLGYRKYMSNFCTVNLP